MKTKYLLSFLICALMSIPTVEAQLLKKIKDKILNSTESEQNQESSDVETDDERSDEEKKAAEKNIMNIFGGSLEGLPDTYEFQYVMDMQLTTKKDQMSMQYYIQPNANYFGNAIADKNANSVIVYDMENQAMVTFMDNGSQKMAMKTRMPFDAAAQKEMAKNDTNQDTGKITPLPNKTILGYNCLGYQIEQEDGVSKFYITNEAPVSFVGVFSSIEQMPKSGYNATIPFDEKSMIMEMEYTSHKRKRDNMHMICTKLEEKPLTINKADY